MLAWWRFLLRGPPPWDPSSQPAPSTLALLGDTFLPLLLASCALFSLILFLFPRLMARHAGFSSWDDRTRTAAGAWATAYPHHVLVTAFGAVCLWREFWGEEGFELRVLAAVVPFSMAYVLVDMVATCLPDLLAGRDRACVGGGSAANAAPCRDRCTPFFVRILAHYSFSIQPHTSTPPAACSSTTCWGF